MFEEIEFWPLEGGERLHLLKMVAIYLYAYSCRWYYLVYKAYTTQTSLGGLFKQIRKAHNSCRHSGDLDAITLKQTTEHKN